MMMRRRRIMRLTRRRLIWGRGLFAGGGVFMLLVTIAVCSGRPVLMIGGISAVVLMFGAAVFIS